MNIYFEFPTIFGILRHTSKVGPIYFPVVYVVSGHFYDLKIYLIRKYTQYVFIIRNTLIFQYIPQVFVRTIFVNHLREGEISQLVTVTDKCRGFRQEHALLVSASV